MQPQKNIRLCINLKSNKAFHHFWHNISSFAVPLTNKLAPSHSAYEEEKALFSTHSITNSCWDVWWGFYMVKQIQEKHESRLELQRTFRTEYSSSRTENWNWSWPFLWPQPFRSSRKSIENSSYAVPDHLLNNMKNK